MDINNISYHKNSSRLHAKPNSDDGITVIHCSDIHLGAEIPFLKHNDAKKRRAEIMNTFKKITEMCNEKAVDLLIISGDLFENHGVDLNTIVAICGGNHDYLSADCPLSDGDWSENVFIFGKELQYVEFPNMKLRLWGTSFTSTYMDTPAFDSVQVPFDSYTNILVMHGDLILKENQISRYNPITLEQLGKSKMDYVALGHIHMTTPIQKVENTYYAYSGCPEGHGFDEQGKKGIYFGNISKGKVDLTFIPMSQRMLIETTIDITNCFSDNEANSKIIDFLHKNFGETFAENLYSITLTGFTNEKYRPNVTYIQSILSELVFYIDIKNSSLPNIDFETLSKDFSLKGIFVKNMLNKIDKCNDAFEIEDLKNALYIGLNAFDKEVALLDN